MNGTLKLLKPFISEELEKLSLEELALSYQISNDTNILASAYSKLFKLIYLIQEQFWGLNEQDIASWSLEILNMCLLTYDSSAKFTTYYGKCFRNKLREETERLNYKKRKSILVSINEVLDTGICDVYNLIDMLIPKDLTPNEKAYCELASEGYDNSYIAQKLNVSRMTISNIRKSLKIKLATLQN